MFIKPRGLCARKENYNLFYYECWATKEKQQCLRRCIAILGV